MIRSRSLREAHRASAPGLLNDFRKREPSLFIFDVNGTGALRMEQKLRPTGRALAIKGDVVERGPGQIRCGKDYRGISAD